MAPHPLADSQRQKKSFKKSAARLNPCVAAPKVLLLDPALLRVTQRVMSVAAEDVAEWAKLQPPKGKGKPTPEQVRPSARTFHTQARNEGPHVKQPTAAPPRRHAARRYRPWFPCTRH